MSNPMLSLDQAHALLAAHLHILPPDRIPLSQAHGRTLRESIAAPEDIPAFDRSAYDGYAARTAELPGTLRITTESAAGHAAPAPLAPGECARIFTGAPLPPGADTVVMQEDAHVSASTAQLPATPRGHGVRLRGEDARAGDTLLTRGQRLGPLETSLLAALGQTQPLVAPRIRLLHIATGAELTAPDVTPGPGQIRDSNSALVAALAAESGCALVAQQRITDDHAALLAAIHSVPESAWEMLLISGGASVGDHDHGLRALRESGFSAHFTKLNLRPGKPLIFATRGRQCSFVLPGNPLSHFVTWHTAVRVALAMLTDGEPRWTLESTRLNSTHPLPGNPRETWWPARIHSGLATPLPWQSSGDITRLVGANALLRIPSAAPEIAPGQALDALRI